MAQSVLCVLMSGSSGDDGACKSGGDLFAARAGAWWGGHVLASRLWARRGEGWGYAQLEPQVQAEAEPLQLQVPGMLMVLVGWEKVGVCV